MDKLFLIIPGLYLVIEAVRGFSKGLLLSVFSLLSWIISVAGSALLVEEFVTKSGKLPEVADVFAGFVGADKAGIIAIGTMFLLMAVFIKIFCLIIMHFFKKVNDIPVVGTVNRIMGALFGIIKGLIVIGLAVFVYALYSGMYLDVIYSHYPQLQIFVELLMEYLRKVWTMVENY